MLLCAVHPVFELQVFKCKEFVTFQSSILAHLKTIESPNEASISTALPGVKEWLCKIDSSIISVRSEQQHVAGKLDGLKELVTKYSENVATPSMFRDALQAGANIFDTVGRGAQSVVMDTELDSQAMVVVAPGPVTHQNNGTCTANLEVPPKFLTATRLIAWWYGKDEYANTSPEGGIIGYMDHNPEHFKAWKKGLLSGPAKLFSRFQELKVGIENYQQRNNIALSHALAHFNSKMSAVSINVLISELKYSGDIPTSRKRKR